MEWRLCLMARDMSHFAQYWKSQSANLLVSQKGGPPAKPDGLNYPHGSVRRQLSTPAAESGSRLHNPYRSPGPFTSNRLFNSSTYPIRLCCERRSDIPPATLYIGDHRLRERRSRLGSVPAKLKRAVAVAVSADLAFVSNRFENTKEMKQ